MLVTYARYVALTGDATSASATVDAALAEAQDLLEDELGRIGFLEDDGEDKVERLRLYDDWVLGGTVYPSALPITSGGTFEQAGATLISVPPDGGPFFYSDRPWERYATVTYRGGFTVATVPAYMARDLAFAAHQLVHTPVPSSIPAGATSVRVGDASVTYAEPAAGGAIGVGWSKATLRHRRRRL